MSMILQTVINERSYPSKERDSNPFSRVALIDPNRLYQSPEKTPECFQDMSRLKPEVIELFSTMEQVLGLFHNSSRLQSIAGEDQIVNVGDLDRALKEVPKKPVSLDVLRSDYPEATGPLMNFFLESASSEFPFLKIGLEFNDNPEWSPSGVGLFLRDSHVGERMKPTFYQPSMSPKGIGRLDCEGWRSGPSPLFGILKVLPTEEFRISPEAVQLIDQYCDEALKDPRTLGE